MDKWTREIPTVEGWYYFCFTGWGLEQAEVMITHVTEHNGRLITGGNFLPINKAVGLWGERIELPLPPTKEQTEE